MVTCEPGVTAPTAPWQSAPAGRGGLKCFHYKMWGMSLLTALTPTDRETRIVSSPGLAL